MHEGRVAPSLQGRNKYMGRSLHRMKFYEENAPFFAMILYQLTRPATDRHSIYIANNCKFN